MKKYKLTLNEIFQNFQIPLHVSIEREEATVMPTFDLGISSATAVAVVDNKLKESGAVHTTEDKEIKEIINASVSGTNKSMKRKKFDQSTSSLYEESLKRRSLRV